MQQPKGRRSFPELPFGNRLRGRGRRAAIFGRARVTTCFLVARSAIRCGSRLGLGEKSHALGSMILASGSLGKRPVAAGPLCSTIRLRGRLLPLGSGSSTKTAGFGPFWNVCGIPSSLSPPRTSHPPEPTLPAFLAISKKTSACSRSSSTSPRWTHLTAASIFTPRFASAEEWANSEPWRPRAAFQGRDRWMGGLYTRPRLTCAISPKAIPAKGNPGGQGVTVTCLFPGESRVGTSPNFTNAPHGSSRHAAQFAAMKCGRTVAEEGYRAHD